jgi:hypothetical protein
MSARIVGVTLIALAMTGAAQARPKRLPAARASAKTEGPCGVYVGHSGHDGIGVRIAFAVRERLRASQRHSLRTDDPAFGAA